MEITPEMLTTMLMASVVRGLHTVYLPLPVGKFSTHQICENLRIQTGTLGVSGEWVDPMATLMAGATCNTRTHTQQAD